ncbi:MAG: hypothetical protein ACXWQO_01810 [Bdellovibrionota bacterium]
MKLFFLLLAFSAPLAQAQDCSLAVYKTYMPLTPGNVICDENKLPAEYAGNLDPLLKGLAGFGYSAAKFDQCKNTESGKAFNLVSQMGDCVQTGPALTCKLYVALYRDVNGKPIFENTIQGVGIGAVMLPLSEALKNLPACQAL